MRQMIAKYPGTCAACNEPISRGEPICFFGKGHAEHLACVQERTSDQEFTEDSLAGFEPGTLASDRRLARQGLSVVRLNSGAVITQNSRGRCIDAPCCGCCS